MPKVSAAILFLVLILFPLSAQARTTPADILNSEKEVFNQRSKNYSVESKQKLETASKKIVDFNREKTAYLESLMERQGEILDEYIYRTGADPRYATDGIKRNLENDVENARYWLTFAHEAVAYQAAKNYILNLTGESSINRDINSTISTMEYDLNTQRAKVIKSQNIIKTLVAK